MKNKRKKVVLSCLECETFKISFVKVMTHGLVYIHITQQQKIFFRKKWLLQHHVRVQAATRYQYFCVYVPR
jgi:hypothetical protein